MLRRLVIGALLACTAPASAQPFPAKPLRLIVPWPAGGSTDLCLRALAQATVQFLGQPIIVENRPGASGTLGAVAMTTAKPDGYTITQIPLSVFRLPHLAKTPFDPMRDITYLVGVSGYTFGVAVRSDAPWQSWSEFIAYAKANPDRVSFGTPGANTSLHITMAQIGWQQGIKWLHVPYKGNAESMAALLGGHVQAAADSTGWGPHVDAGRMRLLVTWGEERTKRWPEVPTLKELGFGIVSTSPYGLGGPKGMDPQVIQILHDAFKKGMEDPAHLAVLQTYDQELWYRSAEAYTRYAQETYAAEKAAMTRLKAQPE